MANGNGNMLAVATPVVDPSLTVSPQKAEFSKCQGGSDEVASPPSTLPTRLSVVALKEQGETERLLRRMGGWAKRLSLLMFVHEHRPPMVISCENHAVHMVTVCDVVGVAID
eukprot:m.41760 g.41760  ORF g.41760 m.41760 type:complete len:112 (-) comp14273_c0_seq2:1015-1350(-)